MKKHILFEITRALIIESHSHVHFRLEAIATAKYLTNRLPTKSLTTKHLSVHMFLFFPPILYPLVSLVVSYK